MNFISILSRDNPKDYAKRLAESLGHSFECIIVNDNGYCSTKQAVESGFCGLETPFRRVASWDKSFYRLPVENYDYFYFIEDDVYCTDVRKFTDFVLECDKINCDLIACKISRKKEYPKWLHWNRHGSKLNTSSLARSFNPLCRLSKKLAIKILEFKNKNKSFVFQELLFSSLCLENNLSMVDFLVDPNLKNYFGRFRYKPPLKNKLEKNLILHPVKFVI